MTLDRDPLRYPVNDADADGDADADVGLDRDQVVALLKRDAQDRAERYTTDGVSAMIPSSRLVQSFPKKNYLFFPLPSSLPRSSLSVSLSLCLVLVLLFCERISEVGQLDAMTT